MFPKICNFSLLKFGAQQIYLEKIPEFSTLLFFLEKKTNFSIYSSRYSRPDCEFVLEKPEV